MLRTASTYSRIYGIDLCCTVQGSRLATVFHQLLRDKTSFRMAGLGTSRLSRQLELKRMCSFDAHMLSKGFTISKTFHAHEVQAFLQSTGDFNPIHSNELAATTAGLPRPVLPGILMASLFPAIIGSTFPGAIYASQTLKFRSSALVGDLIVAEVTVVNVRKGSRWWVGFNTICREGDTGRVLVDGTALAVIPSSSQPPAQALPSI